MDLRQIRYFITLAEVLNFTRAAEISNITQPTLTKAIKKLEEELGAPLIYRDGKDTRLTELGKRLTEEFRKISDLEQSALKLARLENAQENIVVNIGISRTIGPLVINKFLAKTNMDMPDVRIVAHDIDCETAGENLLAGELDCCFCADHSSKNAKLEVANLYSEELHLAFSDQHRFSAMDTIPMEELSNEVYIDRLHCEFRTRANNALRENGIHLNTQLQFSREDWVQTAIASGAGVGTIPNRSIMMPNVSTAPIEGLDLRREVCFLTIYGPLVSPIVNTFRKLVAEFDWS